MEIDNNKLDYSSHISNLCERILYGKWYCHSLEKKKSKKECVNSLKKKRLKFHFEAHGTPQFRVHITLSSDWFLSANLK